MPSVLAGTNKKKNPRGADVSPIGGKTDMYRQKCLAWAPFWVMSRGTREATTGLRWIHSQREIAKMPLLVSLHIITAGQDPQAPFTDNAYFTLYKACKVPLLSISLLVLWKHSRHCSQMPCLFTLTLFLSPSTSPTNLRPEEVYYRYLFSGLV